MPLIQRLLQRDAGSLGLEVEPGSLRSSLPESGFLDVLSALKPLAEFPRLLATVNEQGQTLLHLAVHLRYRELVQKLIHWGIDPNVRDINGFTALHAAYLCDDPFVVGFLEAEGASPFVLDELGRLPTELAAPISSANGTTNWRDEQVVPLAVEEAAFGPAAEKGHSSEYVNFSHAHKQLLTHRLELFHLSAPVIYFIAPLMFLPLLRLSKNN